MKDHSCCVLRAASGVILGVRQTPHARERAEHGNRNSSKRHARPRIAHAQHRKDADDGEVQRLIESFAFLAGRIQRNAPNSLNGWDFSLNVPEIAALTGEDLNGNIGVMRYISMDANVDPYLHRIAIPGRPDLNQMEANLDMGGFDINNARNIDTRNFNVADEMAVNGRLTANGIDSTGSAVVSEVDTDELNSDEIATRNLTASGTVQSVNAVSRTFATGSFTSRDASFNQLSTDVLSGGSIFLTTGNYVEINAARIDAEQVIADRVFVGDN